jgi:hypothetical protein
MKIIPGLDLVRGFHPEFQAGFNHASFGFDYLNPHPKGSRDHFEWDRGYRMSGTGGELSSYALYRVPLAIAAALGTYAIRTLEG